MFFAATTLTSWNDIHKYAQHGWLYRGQRFVAWRLQTSLERCCGRQNVPATQRSTIERALFQEFRRAYHQYSAHVPATGDVLEWLSLMQHHGAPTRLLDFTYSIYVAAYFALEDATEDCIVWAVNGPWALQESFRLLESAGKKNARAILDPPNEQNMAVFGEVFLSDPGVSCACPRTPFRLNERLRIQKGTFLIPGAIATSFEDNLCALPGHDDMCHILKLIIPHACRNEALRALFYMNISRTSLFPGLDGSAQSLGVYHSLFEPVPWAEGVP